MTLRLSEPEIRVAGPADAEGLICLLRERHEENGGSGFDEPKVRRLLVPLLARSSGIVLAVRGKTAIEGSIGLMFSSPWDSSEIELYGLWLFVGQAYRKSTHAKRLIQTAKTYADGLPLRLLLEEIATPKTEEKMNLYRRQLLAERGYRRFEFVPAVMMPAIAEIAAE